jgi:hypothetical protein
MARGIVEDPAFGLQSRTPKPSGSGKVPSAPAVGSPASVPNGNGGRVPDLASSAGTAGSGGRFLTAGQYYGRRK